MHWARVTLTVVAVVALGSSAGATERADAIDRAAAWLAAFPTSELRFDAGVMLRGIRAAHDSPAVEAAWKRARAAADRDHDHPLRRLWAPQLTAPPAVTRGWALPGRGAPRASTERVLIEAVHCDRNGLRHETLRYACGAMRDGGGYHSTHALWALLLAQERGCALPAKLGRCIRHLERELVDAQPRSPQPPTTLAIDLFAERTLMLCLVGAARDPAPDLTALLRLQGADGSWGLPNPDEPAYHRYHATAVACWALAACP